MPRFVNFDSFKFMFDRLKQPLIVRFPVHDTEERDSLGQPVTQKAGKLIIVIEPFLTNTNPNLTYTNTVGGMQSTVNKVWESRAIKHAPRNTTVIDSNHNKYKTVSSTKVTGASLWYYFLKSVGDRY